MAERAIVPDVAAPEAGGQAEQRIAVATQWQLMWWRFRKHKLAVGGTLVLVAFYVVSLFADFFAYVDPQDSDAQRSLIAPQAIHWFDEGRFSPHVFALKGARDPTTFKRVYVPDTSQKVPVTLFGRGEPYQFLGFIPMDRHLFAVEGAKASETLFLLGTDMQGRDLWCQFGVLVVFTPGEEQAGQATEAVEQGDHLRHLGHRHPVGKEEPDGRAGDDTHQNPFIVKTLVEQGHHHAEQHAHRGHQVALPGGGRASWNADGLIPSDTMSPARGSLTILGLKETRLMRALLLYLAHNEGFKNLMFKVGIFRRLAWRFVAGETLDDAVRVVREANRQAVRGTLDLVGENTLSLDDAAFISEDYLRPGGTGAAFWTLSGFNNVSPDSNLIQNNFIKKAGNAIYVSAYYTNVRAIGNIIRGNRIGSETDSLVAWPIQSEHCQNTIIENNIVQNIRYHESNFYEYYYAIGINSYWDSSDIIRNNVVHNIIHRNSQGGSFAICLSGYTNQRGNDNQVYNNMVFDIGGSSPALNSHVAGIQMWWQTGLRNTGQILKLSRR